jgi:hypothetical protein
VLPIQREHESWLEENKEAVSAKIDRALAQFDRGEGISADELRARFSAYRAAWLKDRRDSIKDR